MSDGKMEFDTGMIASLAQELAHELTTRDEHKEVIGAMLKTLRDFEADADVALKVMSGALLLMARAQDAAAGAGAIVAIKLLNCLMPGRKAMDVADIALDMLKRTANGIDDDSPAIRVVVMHMTPKG